MLLKKNRNSAAYEYVLRMVLFGMEISQLMVDSGLQFSYLNVMGLHHVGVPLSALFGPCCSG
jgi:hypothetical protein